MDRTSNRLQRIAIPVQNIFARESSHQLQSLAEMTEFDRNHLETKHLVCIFFKSKHSLLKLLFNPVGLNPNLSINQV
jgi:hypothetical protein